MDKIKNTLQGDLQQWKPIPFWSWNAKLNADRLCAQIDQMKQWGIGGFFMHARSGLLTEYLSEEWMNCIETCSEHAKQNDMDAWIYDEDGWPSGFAGGKLLEDEANCDQYLTYTVAPRDMSASVCYHITEDKLIRIAASEDCGNEEVMNLYIGISIDTADILNPDVTRKFIALTHEQYKTRFGGDLRGKIKGVFSDEPQYHRTHTPYTPMVAKFWKEQFDEDILDGLGLLFVEKEGYRQFRYRYWKAMQHLMLENFSKPVYAWCENNGLVFTGHYIEETALGTQLMCSGGVMPFYEHMHIPGIDWLGRDTSNSLPQIQVASAAAQLGKKQILTESFAGCGWNVTPKELKQIAEFQFVYGVNLLCHHLFPYEEFGQRKRDWPSHFSAYNPWISAEFANFNLYITRLGYLISESKQSVNVAVLHPIRSAYFDYKREADAFGIYDMEMQLQADLQSLTESGFAYHFLDETLLEKHGFVKGKQIGCGNCSYDYVILPHILTMDAFTQKLLKQYVEAGGKVLIWGEKPQFVEAEPDSYEWLQANCSIEEIVADQPYHVAKPNKHIHQTYREIDGRKFLFVMNSSKSETVTQKYNLEPQIRSFQKLDLLTLKEEQVSTELRLNPGESAILFPSTEELVREKSNTTLCFLPENATVQYEMNSLVVDYVRYSFDGCEFSKPVPCAKLFQNLLKERTHKPIWLKYEFDVRHLPETIWLVAENCKAQGQCINGCPVDVWKPTDGEPNILRADIRPYVRIGVNEYLLKIDWFQSEAVYFALFGENVSESTRNKMVYDNELEPIRIVGRFGVYSDSEFIDAEDGYVYGSCFWIGAAPKTVSEPIKEGFPFVDGWISLRQTVHLDHPNVSLQVKGNYLAAYVRVNGKDVGCLLFRDQLDISDFAFAGDNDIEVSFIISKRNLLGPHHWLQKISRGMIPPTLLDYSGVWDHGESSCFTDDYELQMLACHLKENFL